MDIKNIARQVAESAIVLLKNEEQLLPFAGGKTVAVFGRSQLESVLSGSGSGAAHVEVPPSILGELKAKGISAVPALEAFYQAAVEKANADKPAGFDFEKLKNMVNSGLMYEFFGKYTPPAEEFPVPAELVAESAKDTDTALLVIGRQSGGEECDRHLYDDYYLTPAEQALVESVCSAFPKVAVVLNINGLIDLRWVNQYESIKSVVYLGVCGEKGPEALANILCGQVNPSGKLAFTVAENYEDYPTHADFSWDKDHPDTIRTYADYGLDAAANGSTGFEKSPVTLYREGVYLGYRYFDTFGKKPLFPFGFGLSYTTFAVAVQAVAKAENGFTVTAQVTNTGSCAGREVVQLYVSPWQGMHPYQELKAFAKTGTLAPGESQTLTLFVPWHELAHYDAAAAAFVIEGGCYVIRVGNSSVNTHAAARIDVEGNIVTQQCANRLGLQKCNEGKIDFLTPVGVRTLNIPVADHVLTLTAGEVKPYEVPAVPLPGADWKSFTAQQLAALCVGYGPGVPFAALQDVPEPNTVFDENGDPVTTNSHPAGFNGYVSPAIESKGIRSVFYKDGPAGVGETAWPSEMLVACSFDADACRAFGDAVGAECEKLQVDCWLAPAVNLQRHPLGGRNFEYFSEDPFLAGTLAVALAKGVQENHPVLVCAKHFAVNEQETYRRGSTKNRFDAVDSVLTEQTARELYLKPFEMLVKEGDLRCIMSSFNKINGTFAGGSKDLNTHILREEWGFDGVVVTDWGDMDIVVDGADAVAAGNDVVMPGGPPVIAQILKGFEEGRVTRAEMETAVAHLFSFIARFGQYDEPKA